MRRIFLLHAEVRNFDGRAASRRTAMGRDLHPARSIIDKKDVLGGKQGRAGNSSTAEEETGRGTGEKVLVDRQPSPDIGSAEAEAPDRKVDPARLSGHCARRRFLTAGAISQRLSRVSTMASLAHGARRDSPQGGPRGAVAGSLKESSVIFSLRLSRQHGPSCIGGGSRGLDAIDQ